MIFKAFGLFLRAEVLGGAEKQLSLLLENQHIGPEAKIFILGSRHAFNITSPGLHIVFTWFSHGFKAISRLEMEDTGRFHVISRPFRASKGPKPAGAAGALAAPRGAHVRAERLGEVEGRVAALETHERRNGARRGAV